ncbi:hypothetical protein ACH4OX_04280 [Streptomyces roseolus]|uniref:hypothetical protein n=1 Tax=Streptomyces roseolus TaxID=67358 RepID=UPI0037A3D822
MRLRRSSVPLVPLALGSLLVSGCGAGDPEPPAPMPSAPKATATATATPAVAVAVTEGQGERAREAVGSMDDPGFLEGGSAPVAEGAHVRAVLEPGEAYEIAVACVGAGAVTVVVADRGPAAVPCDGVPVRRRVADAPAELPVAITAVGGATGTVAWQIDSVGLDRGTSSGAPDATGQAATGQADGADDDSGKPGRKVRR